MVYKYAEARPGCRMNLILGPNGSGKSSFVCAIVLALGGKPSVRQRVWLTDDPARYSHPPAPCVSILCCI